MDCKSVWLTTRDGLRRKYKYYSDGIIRFDGSNVGEADSLADAIEVMKADYGEAIAKVEVHDD